MVPNIIVAASIIILAVVGAALWDRKKETLQPDTWPEWENKTSYSPFGAIVSGKARLRGFSMHALGGGLVLWLAGTWAHFPLAGWPTGIWRWAMAEALRHTPALARGAGKSCVDIRNRGSRALGPFLKMAPYGGLAPCGRSLRRTSCRTNSNRSLFATQFDDLKIGSDTGICFKVGV